MDSDSLQTRRALSAVDEILWLHWDPIGVNKFPDARDEYVPYAPQVLGLLRAGSTDAAVAEFLDRIEVEQMGLDPRPLQRLQPTVDALRRAVGL